MKPVCVIGDGAWGTACATVLAHNKVPVKLWCASFEVFSSIKNNRINEKYLPGVVLDPLIKPVMELEEALDEVSWIFEAVPVKFLRSVFGRACLFIQPHQRLVVLSKGIEADTLLLPAEILDDVLGNTYEKLVISGPSFAYDLARKQPTRVMVAGKESLIHEIENLLQAPYFRLQRTNDIIGIQVAGALKNIIALGIGMLEGAGYGDNTKAYFFTRGLEEITRLVEACGGHKDSVLSLAGMGDLVLTCFGRHSKNLALGKQFAHNDIKQKVLVQKQDMPEGFNTLRSIHQLARRHALDLPLMQTLYDVVYGTASLDELTKIG